jgi:hypothetical protein
VLAKQSYLSENITCRAIFERKGNVYEAIHIHHSDISAAYFNSAFITACFSGKGVG